MLVASQNIVKKSQNDNSSIHYARPIHVGGRDGDRRRKERKDNGEQCVCSCKNVDCKAPSAKVPRPEVDLLIPDSLAYEKHDGNEVGRQVAGDDKRDDGIESH